MATPAINFATTSSGSRVAFVIQGNGPTVVVPPMTVWTLVPPRRVPPDADFWRLSEGSQFLAYDHVGTGMSQRTGYDFSLDAAVEELRAVVDAAGVEDFVVLALLYAGPIAIRFAVEHPHRVKHLLLRNTWADSRAAAQRRLMMFGEALQEGDWVAASQIYARLGWNLSGEEAEAIAENIRASAEPDVLMAYFNGAMEHDARPLLGDIAVPTTVIGQADAPMPMNASASRGSDELVQAIPGAELRMLGRDDRWDWRTYASFLGDGFAADGDPPTDANELGTPASADGGSRGGGLSPREVEVIALVADGASNHQIADQLVIAQSTVANHIRNILNKTGTANRTAAGAWAVRHGLVEE